MRLLDTSTRKLHEFYGSQIPEYAILSHCWGEQEVSFEEYDPDGSQAGSGYQKIAQACLFALGRGIGWLWVDTCCIDKRSSAELSEAINSMFLWYSRAAECYAHLEDVTFHEGDVGKLVKMLQASRWFTRGWTLQELIAPSLVIFVTHDWKIIGCKKVGGIGRPYARSIRAAGEGVLDMIHEVSEITHIPTHVLGERTRLRRCSIAMRMSWVARRKTTRAEDLVYCLLGIFSINIAPLYGEGLEKAFLRLQREIIAVSDDESIFAWRCVSDTKSLPILANTPYHFSGCSSAIADKGSMRKYQRSPYTITNQGLEFRLHAGPNSGVYVKKTNLNRLILLLNCNVYLNEGDRGKVVSCFVELKFLLCGHYGKASDSSDGFKDVREEKDWSQWEPLRQDLICYVHMLDSTLSCG